MITEDNEMNKKEKPKSKITVSFRPFAEEEAFYREQAEKADMSVSQYIDSIVRKAHEEMFSPTPKVEENLKNIQKVKIDSDIDEETETKGGKAKLPMTNEEMEKLIGKLSDSNLDFLISNHLATQAKKHKTEVEKTAKEAEKSICEKIHSESIVIPASPELREVFNMFVEHHKKGSEMVHPYELLVKLFENEFFWDRNPKVDKALWKKAMSKDYLKKT